MAKRCLIVTYYFPPTGGGGIQRNVKLIKYLSRENWKFTVLTANESSANLPYDETLQSEIPKDVEIIPVPFLESLKINSYGKRVSSFFKSTFVLRLISSFFFIPDRHKNWLKPVKKKILHTLGEKKFDLVLVSSPPYSLVKLAAELTNELSIPVILDMRDPWTINPYKIYPSRWHLIKDRKIETKFIEQIKYGISAYQSLLKFYTKNITNFKQENWRFIPNGFDEEDFNNLEPQELEEGKFHVAFSGTFYSHVNKPHFLLKGMAAMEKSRRVKVCFHHIGVSAINIKNIARQYGLENNIIEWGYHNHKRCLNILAGMDAFCFILDSSNKNADKTIGGKVYEYLRLGKPILALIPTSGEPAKLIRETNSGIVIDPYDHFKIAKTISAWMETPPKKMISPKYSSFERLNLAKQYKDFFEQVIDSN